MKTIKINKIQEQILIKAINGIKTLYDFDETNQEFKESWSYTKNQILKAKDKLSEGLK